MKKIAILNDYQNVALEMADWSSVTDRADITVFSDHLADTEAVIDRLLPFDAICVMRERTPLPRDVIERLPRLKLIASTGSRNASIDVKAAEERGIRVAATGYRSTPTIEMTWALILANTRQSSGRAIPSAVAAGRHRSGGNSRAGCWACSALAMSAARSRASAGLSA